MIKPDPNQRRSAWRLGVFSILIFIVLILTAIMPMIAQDAKTESIQVQTPAILKHEK